MKILFFKDVDDKRKESPTDLDPGSDIDTMQFLGTEIANIDRDDEQNFTVYTTGNHFYITLSEVDVKQIASKLTPHEMFQLLSTWVVGVTRMHGGIDLVMKQLKSWVIESLSEEGWI